MATTGKCPICGIWLELSESGHLPEHRPKNITLEEAICAGSGAVPVRGAKNPSADPKPKGKQTPPQQEEDQT